MCVRQLIDTLTSLCNEHGMAEHEILVHIAHDFGGDKARISSVGAHGDTVYICGGGK